MSAAGRGIPLYELEDYQRAFRLLLQHPLVTERYPDPRALALVRRWSGPLRADFADLLGYRLELHATCARLVRSFDDFDPTQGLRTVVREGRPGRLFDRTRYVYLCLVLAALGRAATQVSLTELAAAVTTTAAGLEVTFDPRRYADRLALVDVVAWLQHVGALTPADSTATSWVDSPEDGEVLYDIDRVAAAAVFRPPAIVQQVASASDLLARPVAHSRDTRRQDAARRARRLLVERPVVLDAQIDPDARANLRQSRDALGDVRRLTGARVERRAEGHALIDPPGGRLSDQAFPTYSYTAAAALLLVTEVADRHTDPDQPPLPTLPLPTLDTARAALAATLDGCRPQPAGPAAAPGPEPGDDGTEPGDDGTEPGDDGTAPPAGAADAAWGSAPLLTTAWLRAAMRRVLAAHPDGFGGVRGEPDQLADDAVDLLVRMHLAARVDGGMLALPAMARYRNTVASVPDRPPARPPAGAPDDDPAPGTSTGTGA